MLWVKRFRLELGQLKLGNVTEEYQPTNFKFSLCCCRYQRIQQQGDGDFLVGIIINTTGQDRIVDR